MIAGAVLSAGASMRMGSPKALVRIGQSTFLDSMTKSLLDGGCEPVITVLAHDAEQIQAGCDLENVDVFLNPNPDLGQISSLLCAVDAARDSDGILFVLVDQARISSGTVREVAEALRYAPCAVARYMGQAGHPTAFSKELFDELNKPEVMQFGAKVLVEELKSRGDVAWIDVDDPGVTRNINTPEQLGVFSERGF